MRKRYDLDTEDIISAYEAGESLYAIAKRYNSYPGTIRTLLQRNNIELRNDKRQKGTFIIKDGEKLIEWAKAQGRLVTKAELARVIGTKRLSPSYFLKYPELGQYVRSYEQQDTIMYVNQLYDWLKENDIKYKPNDKTALEGTSVQALLLGEYDKIAIVVDIKGKTLSKAHYKKMINRRVIRSKEKNISILYLKKEDFENLDTIRSRLNELRDAKEK